VSKNPILVTALNAIIGYDLAAKIAKKAFAEDRPLIDVAEELTDLSRSELETILNPTDLTRPGIASS
jgi:fumarate hydratase class II